MVKCPLLGVECALLRSRGCACLKMWQIHVDVSLVHKDCLNVHRVEETDHLGPGPQVGDNCQYDKLQDI